MVHLAPDVQHRGSFFGGHSLLSSWRSSTVAKTMTLLRGGWRSSDSAARNRLSRSSARPSALRRRWLCYTRLSPALGPPAASCALSVTPPFRKLAQFWSNEPSPVRLQLIKLFCGREFAGGLAAFLTAPRSSLAQLPTCCYFFLIFFSARYLLCSVFCTKRY